MLDVTKTDANHFKSLPKIQRQNYLTNIWIISSQILNLKTKNRNKVRRQPTGKWSTLSEKYVLMIYVRG